MADFQWSSSSSFLELPAVFTLAMVEFLDCFWRYWRGTAREVRWVRCLRTVFQGGGATSAIYSFDCLDAQLVFSSFRSLAVSIEDILVKCSYSQLHFYLRLGIFLNWSRELFLCSSIRLQTSSVLQASFASVFLPNMLSGLEGIRLRVVSIQLPNWLGEKGSASGWVQKVVSSFLLKLWRCKCSSTFSRQQPPRACQYCSLMLTISSENLVLFFFLSWLVLPMSLRKSLTETKDFSIFMFPNFLSNLSCWEGGFSFSLFSISSLYFQTWFSGVWVGEECSEFFLWRDSSTNSSNLCTIELSCSFSIIQNSVIVLIYYHFLFCSRSPSFLDFFSSRSPSPRRISPDGAPSSPFPVFSWISVSDFILLWSSFLQFSCFSCRQA